MKNKFLITGLATATLLSTAALTQLSPSVYAATTTQPSAEEKAKQDEILANFDKALAETIKGLEEEAKNDPDSAESIKETIAKLKAEAAKEKAKIVEGFNAGKTADATENEIEEIAKEEEAVEAEEAKAEEEAQKEFLANFDKALEDAIAELKKADTQNDPELAKQVEDAIAKLKEEAAKQKKEIEDGFKNGLTVEEAEKAIDDANNKAAEEAKAEAEEKAKQDEFLANYDKALEEAVKELEKAETNSPEEAKAKADTIAALKAASDETRKQIVEGFKKGLTAKQAEKLIDELNKKAAEEDKEAANKPAKQPKSDKVESSNGQEAPVNEVPEFDLSTLGTATGTQTQASARQTAQTANAQAQEAPTANTPARTSANSAQAATEEKPAEKSAVALAVAEAPKAEESKQAELPNTGSAEFTVFTPAVLSILAGLGLVAPKGKKEDK